MKFYNSYGQPKPERPDPKPLKGQTSIAFQGMTLKSVPESTMAWGQVTSEGHASNPLLKKFVTGKDLNTHPRQDSNRWVIDEEIAYRWYRPGLRKALKSLSSCLVCSKRCKHLVFSFQPTDKIYSQNCVVFPAEGFLDFTILQSRVHEIWARSLCSTPGNSLIYTQTNCVENFPLSKKGQPQ